MAQLQRKDSDDDLLAGWSGELEALLYSPEVEEAIKEVSTGDDINVERVSLSSSFSLSLDYINELFPSELQLGLKTKIR